MFALMVMAILSIGTSVLWSQIHSQLSQQRQSWHREQAFQLAEAGLEQAIVALRAAPGQYTGEADVLLGPGHFTVTVMAANEAGAYQIESWGALDLAAYRYDRAGLRAELTLSPSGRLERYAVQPIKGEP
jgi:type II secretory pathway component PulJ